MSRSFKTVDLFAGPGGLAEGFSSLRNAEGKRIFDIALSVEKEPSAFATLRLRAFTRQFTALPDCYYQYLAGEITRQTLADRYPEEWKAAEDETAMLELGTEDAQQALDPCLDRIRKEADGDTIVIGGPPCQAYSLVGRARNRGIKNYDPATDHRHFLYREYIRILGRLQPIAFVMENVKGMLSSRVKGESIFERVLNDLRAAGGEPDSYTLLPLVDGAKGRHAGRVIRSEDFGIPQCRHRVILLGIRSDVLANIPASTFGRTLEPASRTTVASVLTGMPALRSGLSRSPDTPDNWRVAAVSAFRTAASACRNDGTWLNDVAKALSEHARQLEAAENMLPRSSRQVTPIKDNRLGAWLADERLPTLPNHESRGHMESDLARYAFAATFAEKFDRSPKAEEFPAALAPDHSNWESGHFADRFRVQHWKAPSTTVTSHISKDGHYFIHPDPAQCRSLTVREAARLQTFPDNYFFEGNRTQQYVQVGNAVPPLLARQIAELVADILNS
ncbi:DNA cytosine methyltransferase [Sphingobium indicum]|uniref:DNA (cytosine-5-)-methyltransferase n=2 Tax=Sphingobium indicum TaxID=332055 RepID=A0A1L5BRQ0_SPHIB|nr:DNA cytosine methyltransferase [Sphingobium indicum]APL95571.1 cytosine methyltransferase [Sphingobium indicum B90A]KEZ00660.1 cytosine methyltransferase [Sphingomonas sp. BHC-A]NYI23141.1 DNA (cytosine-5)-methyltransferase 1 [Sphingobium indicum]RYM01788.1 DNA cytosine methyltransferase [Sphingobium indicum]